jgi:hypothetical protein
MKTRLDLKKIAKSLGGERRGKVAAKSGYFGAMQLLADLEARFRVPSKGGRATDPSWTEQRLLRLAPNTLRLLEELADRIKADRGISIGPMQLAALILEEGATRISLEEAEDLVEPREVNAAGSRGRRGGG